MVEKTSRFKFQNIFIYCGDLFVFIMTSLTFQRVSQIMSLNAINKFNCTHYLLLILPDRKYTVAFKINKKNSLLYLGFVQNNSIYAVIVLRFSIFSSFPIYSELSFKSFTRTSDWLSRMIILFSSPKIFSSELISCYKILTQ